MTTVIKGQLTPGKIAQAIEDFNKKVEAQHAKKTIWQFLKSKIKKQQKMEAINFITVS